MVGCLPGVVNKHGVLIVGYGEQNLGNNNLVGPEHVRGKIILLILFFLFVGIHPRAGR